MPGAEVVGVPALAAGAGPGAEVVPVRAAGAGLVLVVADRGAGDRAQRAPALRVRRRDVGGRRRLVLHVAEHGDGRGRLRGREGGGLRHLAGRGGAGAAVEGGVGGVAGDVARGDHDRVGRRRWRHHGLGGGGDSAADGVGGRRAGGAEDGEQGEGSGPGGRAAQGFSTHGDGRGTVCNPVSAQTMPDLTRSGTRAPDPAPSGGRNGHRCASAMLLRSPTVLTAWVRCPARATSSSSSGLGLHPFKVATRVRIPLGARTSARTVQHHGLGTSRPRSAVG